MRFDGLIVVTSLLLLARPALGQEAFWEFAEPTIDPSVIVTDGELVEAYNGSPVEDEFVIVNDVPFLNTRFGALTGAATGMLLGGTTEDPDMDGLLNDLSFGGGTSTSIMLGDESLQIGQPYVLQVFFTDMRNCCNQRVMTYGLDGVTVDVHASEGGGFGQFALGYFVATSPSQELTLQTNGFGNAHLSAYQLREAGGPVMTVDGDFNADGAFDTADIDSLSTEIIAGNNSASFDLNGDGAVDLADQEAWLAAAATINGFSQPYLNGDANLDGTVNAMDLNAMAVNWQQDIGSWSQGDFNGDQKVNASDLNAMAVNWQESVPMGAAAAAVPEPSAGMLLWPFLAVGLFLRKRTAS